MKNKNKTGCEFCQEMVIERARKKERNKKIRNVVGSIFLSLVVYLLSYATGSIISEAKEFLDFVFGIFLGLVWVLLLVGIFYVYVASD